MNVEDVLLEEYKTVRQESLEAAARVQGVAQYLLAGMGVGITGAVLAADNDRTLGAATLMALVPLLVVFGTAMMTLEVQRVLGARQHLRQLETRLNGRLGSPALTWEATRVGSGSFRVVNPFRSVFAIAVAGILVAGPGIAYVLLRDGITTWYYVGAGIDVLIAIVLIVVGRRKYKELQELERD